MFSPAFLGVWQIKPAQATRVFYDGFEDGTVNAWSDTWNRYYGDNSVLSSGPVYNGTYSLQVLLTSDGGWDVIANTVADNQLLFMRYIFTLEAISVNDGGLLTIDGFTYGSGWDPLALVGIKRSGYSYVWASGWGNGAGSLNWVNSTSPMKLHQWYEVQLGLYRHASAGWVSLKVNGTLLSNTTSLNLGANNPTRFEVGLSGPVSTVYFDDVMIDTAEMADIITTSVDTSPPLFGAIYANTTISGSPVRLSCAITDDTEVANYTYSWNNTGTWLNQTTVNTSGNQVPSIHDGTWNITSGYVVSVIVYANDTLLNEGASIQYNFTLTTENQAVVPTITNPANTTYASSSIPVFLSASGGTIDKIIYNVKNGTSWIYGTNQTYTTSLSLTGFVNGTSYNMTMWANNTYGNSATANVMFSVAIANVYSVTAASGHAPDIETAITNVDNHGGGIVYIPAGTYNFYNVGETWSTVVVPEGVSIIGAEPTGINNSLLLYDGTSLGIPTTWTTVLVMPWDVAGTPDNKAIWFAIGETPTAQHNTLKTIRFANIKFQGYRSIDPTSISEHIAITVTQLQNFRIDHCNFEHTTGGGVVLPAWLDWNLWSNGVIDHNKFENWYGFDDLVNYINGNIGYGIELHRAYNGVTFDPTMSVLGQANNYTIFIENNFFSEWRHCVSSGHGAYWVFRYNLVTHDFGHYSLDVHGLRDTESGRAGSRGFEVYENTFTEQTDFSGLFQDGGGCGVWFNNYVDSSYWKIALYAEDYVASTTWHLADFYMWSAIGIIIAAGYPTGPISSSRNVTEDWTRQAGNPSSPSYPNVNPSWSIAGYIPYRYPHPLVSGTSQATLVISINSPTNTTYTTYSSSSISVTLYTSGATADRIWWNCTFTNGTVAYANTTYTVETSMTLGNGTYLFNAMANNTDGDRDTNSVMFSVSIYVDTSIPLEVSLNTPANLATSTSFSVSFVYTPTVRGDIFYHSELWLNLSGIYQIAAYNSSIIANYTTNTITYVFNANNTYIWNIKIWNSTTGVFASSARTLIIGVGGVDWYQITVNCISLDSANVNAYLTKQFLNGSTVLDYTEGTYSLLAGTITIRASYLGMLVNSTDFAMATYGNTTVSLTVNMKALSIGGFLAVNKSATIVFKNQTSTLINATITAAGTFQVACLVPANASLVQLDGVNVTDWLFNATNLSLRANLTSGDFSMTFAETLGEPWFGVTVVLVSLGSLGSAIWYYRRAAKKKSKVVPAG